MSDTTETPRWTVHETTDDDLAPEGDPEHDCTGESDTGEDAA